MSSKDKWQEYKKALEEAAKKAGITDLLAYENEPDDWDEEKDGYFEADYAPIARHMPDEMLCHVLNTSDEDWARSHVKACREELERRQNNILLGEEEQ